MSTVIEVTGTHSLSRERDDHDVLADKLRSLRRQYDNGLILGSEYRDRAAVEFARYFLVMMEGV